MRPSRLLVWRSQQPLSSAETKNELPIFWIRSPNNAHSSASKILSICISLLSCLAVFHVSLNMYPYLLYILPAFSSLFWQAYSAPTFKPLLPPSYPLAVRSPYLSGKNIPSSYIHILISSSMASWRSGAQFTGSLTTILVR